MDVKALGCAVVALLAGCGSAGTSVSGTIAGEQFTAVDAVEYQFNGSYWIAIGNFADECAYFQGAPGLSKASSEILDINFAVQGVGSYTILQDPIEAGFNVYGSDCSETGGSIVKSGSVTFTRNDATGAAGTFQFVFASGDELSGRFDAPACSLPDAGPGGASCS
ncbi:MAG TPA: hypothetical protein VMB50_17490 [Myxococcales bacterium]|nr:hypothetical protein [Myxococcales bacterium]